MINSLLPSMNLFMQMWNVLPPSIIAFVRWVLGVFIVVGLYYVVKDWIK